MAVFVLEGRSIDGHHVYFNQPIDPAHPDSTGLARIICEIPVDAGAAIAGDPAGMYIDGASSIPVCGQYLSQHTLSNQVGGAIDVALTMLGRTPMPDDSSGGLPVQGTVDGHEVLVKIDQEDPIPVDIATDTPITVKLDEEDPLVIAVPEGSYLPVALVDKEYPEREVFVRRETDPNTGDDLTLLTVELKDPDRTLYGLPSICVANDYQYNRQFNVEVPVSAPIDSATGNIYYQRPVPVTLLRADDASVVESVFVENSPKPDGTGKIPLETSFAPGVSMSCDLTSYGGGIQLVPARGLPVDLMQVSNRDVDTYSVPVNVRQLGNYDTKVQTRGVLETHVTGGVDVQFPSSMGVHGDATNSASPVHVCGPNALLPEAFSPPVRIANDWDHPITGLIAGVTTGVQFTVELASGAEVNANITKIGDHSVYAEGQPGLPVQGANSTVPVRVSPPAPWGGQSTWDLPFPTAPNGAYEFQTNLEGASVTIEGFTGEIDITKIAGQRLAFGSSLPVNAKITNPPDLPIPVVVVKPAPTYKAYSSDNKLPPPPPLKPNTVLPVPHPRWYKKVYDV